MHILISFKDIHCSAFLNIFEFLRVTSDTLLLILPLRQGKRIYLHGFNPYHFMKHLKISTFSLDFSAEFQWQMSSCLTGTSAWMCCRHFKLGVLKVDPGIQHTCQWCCISIPGIHATLHSATRSNAQSCPCYFPYSHPCHF